MKKSFKNNDQIKEFDLYSSPLKEIQQISFEFLLSQSNKKQQCSMLRSSHKNQVLSPKKNNYGSSLTYLEKHAKYIKQKYQNCDYLAKRKRIQQYEPLIKIKTLNRTKQCITFDKAKKILQKSDDQYKNQYQHIFNSLVELQNRIDSKINQRNKQYSKMEEQLVILQGFTQQMKKQFKIEKINPKSKFTKFLQENTPKKNKVNKVGQNQQQTSQKKRINKLFHSNISLKSPSLYLSANSQKQKEGSLLLSFKKSTQRDQEGYETLKYSQDSNHYGLKFKPHRQYQKDQIIEQPSYSPVLPYRFQKLQKQRQRQIQKHKNRASKSYIDKNQKKVKETQIKKNPPPPTQISCNQGQWHIHQNLTMYFNTSTRNKLKKQHKQNQNFKKQLNQACNTLQPLTEKVLHQIAQEKVMSSQNWNNVGRFMENSIQELLKIMSIQQDESLITQDKMTTHLSYIAQSLQYDLQCQKTQRKAQQQTIMKMLSKIVETIQNQRQL